MDAPLSAALSDRFPGRQRLYLGEVAKVLAARGEEVVALIAAGRLPAVDPAGVSVLPAAAEARQHKGWRVTIAALEEFLQNHPQ